MKLDSFLRGIFPAIFIAAGSVFSAGAFVGVQPPTVEIFEPAGKKVSGSFTVNNPMQSEVEVEVVPEPFPGATGMKEIPHQEWLKLSRPKPFKLKPGESKSVKYKVQVPKKLSGETMAMAFFNIFVSEPSMQDALVKRRHGVPIYVVAKDSERVQMEIKDLYARFGKSDSESPIEFLITVQNGGNVHLRPTGIVQILKNGSMIEEAKLESGFPVYPGGKHQYGAHSAKLSWETGEYEAKFVVYFGSEFGRGAQQEKILKFKVGADRKIDLING